jgi:hypothetical protein
LVLLQACTVQRQGSGRGAGEAGCRPGQCWQAAADLGGGRGGQAASPPCRPMQGFEAPQQLYPA